MAEAIARSLIDRGEIPGVGRELFIASAGVAAGDGIPISEQAIQALKKLGIEHDGTSKRLTPEMASRASVILGMTDAHVEEIHRLLAEGKADASVRLEKLNPSGSIQDPVGMGQAAYDRAAKQFIRLLPGRLTELLK